MGSLRIEDRGHIRILTLDRPERRNAIDQALAEELSAAFEEIEADRAVRAVVLTGGPEFFCAGTDLSSAEPPRTEAGGPYGFLARVRRTPLIAAVEGFAFGGGFECVLASDLVVAARGARFGAPEVKRGVVANTGALFRAGERLPFNVATEMLLTGDPVDAERGHALGFVNVLTEPGDALAGALALTERIVVNSPDAVAISLGTVARHAAEREARAWELTAEADAEIAGSPDRAEGITAFFEKRPPNWG
ncbi:enoyl-CoA hydratase-related protein [Nocardioides sp. AE5]|uniref:enoyl-CoA hydratase-related protein n=1 Tax=Nocardioides sp. AE5 TaxID=2962573 RepID=UPI00288189F9|nr:enoyl-CoA hydratase-related protein [Nocardioides sp. AE5]MDT0203236.1 enoyl-CoA hydratase-related protein [Nocardioides sp. AE5]